MVFVRFEESALHSNVAAEEPERHGDVDWIAGTAERWIGPGGWWCMLIMCTNRSGLYWFIRKHSLKRTDNEEHLPAVHDDARDLVRQWQQRNGIVAEILSIRGIM